MGFQGKMARGTRAEPGGSVARMGVPGGRAEIDCAEIDSAEVGRGA